MCVICGKGYAVGKGEEVVVASKFEFAGALPVVERWHKLAQTHSRLAIWAAACCGHELLGRKADIGHGGWMKFLKALPFSHDTARRYMDLAVAWKQRTGQSPTEIGASGTRLLEDGKNAAIDIPEDEVKEITDHVNESVGETTLRQLYFDWGIVKAPPKPGGNVRKDKPTAPTEAEIELTYRTEWARILEDLTEHGRRQRTYVHLEDGELENHRAGLAYVVSELDDEIKRRSNAKKGRK